MLMGFSRGTRLVSAGADASAATGSGDSTAFAGMCLWKFRVTIYAPDMPPLRCRLHLHRWVRRRSTDTTLAEPSLAPTWQTVCRDCGVAQTSGTLISAYLFAMVLLAGVGLFWVAPFLGAVLVIGAMGGLMWSMRPGLIGRLARWLSVG